MSIKKFISQVLIVYYKALSNLNIFIYLNIDFRISVGSWRASDDQVSIKSIINPNNTHWSIQTFRGHNDRKHSCYGTNSTTEVSSSLIFFAYGPYCYGYLCKVSVEYLHSWDTSYIASSKCDLYSVDKNSKEKGSLIDSVSIFPNKCGHHGDRTVTGTYMCSHVLKLKYVGEEGQYFSIECRSAEIGKLACIGGVEVFFDG